MLVLDSHPSLYAKPQGALQGFLCIEVSWSIPISVGGKTEVCICLQSPLYIETLHSSFCIGTSWSTACICQKRPKCAYVYMKPLCIFKAPSLYGFHEAPPISVGKKTKMCTCMYVFVYKAPVYMCKVHRALQRLLCIGLHKAFSVRQKTLLCSGFVK